MTSLPPPTTTTTTTNITTNSSSYYSTLISTMSPCPFFKRRRPARISLTKKRNHLFEVSSKAIDNNDYNSSNGSKIGETSPGNYKLDRRNVVLGLGGLYSLGGTTTTTPLTLAAPVETPDFKECGPAEKDGTTEKIDCCPPINTKNIIDFKLPPPPKTMRVRPPAHLVDKEYIKKYSIAVELMKKLPKDDPRNFYQQANVHCAYCDGAYDQVGYPNVTLQVHSSWLFFPFHRWYLYFYEKILGKLIDDPNFSLPFWNWDAPAGMQMPPIYTNDPNSPLYDPYRNPHHQPPTLIDLQTHARIITPHEQVAQNLVVMNRQMIRNSKDPTSFFGKSYRAGCPPNPGAGSIEHIPHNIVHNWTGNPKPPYEDMGVFYSAARDPIFYSHHSNVDRMWTIWTDLQKKKKKPTRFTDSDWLKATFLFYDENKQAVRVTVKDCLDNTRLGYIYQDMSPLPWLDTKPTPKVDRQLRQKRKAKGINGPPRDIVNDFPIKLDKVVRTEVPRPNKSRSEKEKEDIDEKLEIEIEVDSIDVFVQFDVYVNDEGVGQIGPENTEFAGSFVHLPHMRMKNGMNKMKTSLSLSISDLLEDLGAEDDDSVVVTLVPKFGEVTITGIDIES